MKKLGTYGNCVHNILNIVQTNIITTTNQKNPQLTMCLRKDN